MVFARIPPRHECLEAVAQRPAGKEFAVKLLEDLEAGIGRRTRRRLRCLFLFSSGGFLALFGLGFGGLGFVGLGFLSRLG